MPNDAETYYQLGLAHLGTANTALAVNAFQKTIALNPKHPGPELKLSSLMLTSNSQALVENAKKRLEDLMAVAQ